jgi:hypothetical protein
MDRLKPPPRFKRSFRLLTAAFAGDRARVDDLIVLSENAADRGGMDLEQGVGLGRAR